MDEDDGPSHARQGRHPSTAGLEETVWSELLVAVHGIGRGNSRSHNDKNAKENCREQRTPTATRPRRLHLPKKAKRHEERTLKRRPCGACVSVVRRSCGQGENNDAHE